MCYWLTAAMDTGITAAPAMPGRGVIAAVPSYVYREMRQTKFTGTDRRVQILTSHAASYETLWLGP